jgi:hypothetical protein
MRILNRNLKKSPIHSILARTLSNLVVVHVAEVGCAMVPSTTFARDRRNCCLKMTGSPSHKDESNRDGWVASGPNECCGRAIFEFEKGDESTVC